MTNRRLAHEHKIRTLQITRANQATESHDVVAACDHGVWVPLGDLTEFVPWDAAEVLS